MGARPKATGRLDAVRRALLAVVLALGAVPVTMAPAATAADAGPADSGGGATELTGDVTFYGRGWGHGVGMSQYGARGRALAGQTAADILARYYPGTTLATISASTPVRVLLVSSYKPTSSSPVRIFGRGGSWTVDGVTGSFPADGSITLLPTLTSTGTTTWRVSIRAADGTSLYAGAAPSTLRIRPAASATRLQVGFKASSYNVYRGVIRLTSTSAGRVTAVNEVALDLYLRGVVPTEMPSTWPTEALRAQAIAARSYASRRLHPTTGSYDVYDDTRSQVYRGSKAEKSTTSSAIVATAGTILKSGSSIANTVFHSAAGGATENNENVWTSSSGAVTSAPVSYLRGGPDRDPSGKPYDAASPYATWQTATYSVEALSSFFAADPRTDVGMLTALDLSNRGVSGRPISVTLVGSEGSKTVSSEIFRTVFNTYSPLADPAMRSTLFDLAPIP